MSMWLNGRIVDAALIPATDRGFTLGDGLFETMALTAGKVRHLDRHLSRLRHGAGVLAIPLTLTDHHLSNAIDQLVQTDGAVDGVVRLTLTRGSGARGLLPPADPSPTMVMTLAAKPAVMGPARLCLSTITRRNEFSPLSAIKSLNYLDAVLARQDAAQRGFDDVILLNSQGRVAETSVSSIFAVIEGVLCTPPVADGALPGVARALVLDRLGAQQRPLLPADLCAAAEVILTNALGVRAVCAIGDAVIPAGNRLSEIQAVIELS